MKHDESVDLKPAQKKNVGTLYGPSNQRRPYIAPPGGTVVTPRPGPYMEPRLGPGSSSALRPDVIQQGTGTDTGQREPPGSRPHSTSPLLSLGELPETQTGKREPPTGQEKSEPPTGQEKAKKENPPMAEKLKIDYSDPTIAGQNIEAFSSDQITNPALPPGTQTPTIPIKDKGGEELTGGEGITDFAPTETQIYKSTTTTADTTDIPTVAPGTYDATQGTAAQEVVTTESTIQGQLTELMKDVDAGTATWANGAIRHANKLMIERGLGASSIAGAAISTAILEAAIPIAKYDASVYGQMNLENFRNRQATMLSNTAATNAASQFNAKNTQETDKFMAELRDRLIRLNVEQTNAMSKFNTGEANTAGKFYAKMNNEMDKFMSNNRMLIQKSNAEWRRTINLANTASANSALHQDVQNRFNLSAQATAELWQRARDVFHWANQSSENVKERAAKIAYYSLQQSTFTENRTHDENRQTFLGIGSIIADIINKADLFGTN